MNCLSDYITYNNTLRNRTIDPEFNNIAHQYYGGFSDGYSPIFCFSHDILKIYMLGEETGFKYKYIHHIYDTRKDKMLSRDY